MKSESECWDKDTPKELRIMADQAKGSVLLSHKR